MFKLLVAEDDNNLRNLISINLRNEGYNVIACENGEKAIELLEIDHFDLVISDIMMPKLDGYGLVKKIRDQKLDTPILFLTALGSIEDKEKGYTLSIDDYLVKPINMKELLMKVKAILRRCKLTSEQKITIGKTSLDFNTNIISIDGKNIELTKKQFLLIFKLLSTPNRIFSRDQLMDEIWGYETYSDYRTVDTHISWLRDKIKSDDFTITTVRGIGYKAVIKSDKEI